MHPTPDGPNREFEELVHAHYRPLYRFAHSLTRDEAEASDLTQQTFYLWGSKGHALRDRSKAKAWLFTTLHREFLKSRRRERQFPHRAIEEGDGDLPAPASSTVEHLDSETALGMLESVEEVYRTPLTLFYLGDHSYLEISAILSVPLGTVQSRIARGKAQLRALLTRGDRPGEGTERVGRG